ncbi:MAG: GIY-YIG nuclease family protein [Candidatus Taylorbacteria bacterium]|nr:GIY-YIG nuclease family protein [Candidatus Taylorbacteria bacterium]
MFTIYILQCKDKTLYTGSTTDMEKRLKEHNEQKKGAKYTRARRPVTLVYEECCETLAQARSREAEIKRMTRQKKLLLLKKAVV